MSSSYSRFVDQSATLNLLTDKPITQSSTHSLISNNNNHHHHHHHHHHHRHNHEKLLHGLRWLDMLVPRRKGQMLKLLILVSLSLLLVTSFFYQWPYYEAASGQRQLPSSQKQVRWQESPGHLRGRPASDQPVEPSAEDGQPDEPALGENEIADNESPLPANPSKSNNVEDVNSLNTDMAHEFARLNSHLNRGANRPSSVNPLSESELDSSGHLSESGGSSSRMAPVPGGDSGLAEAADRIPTASNLETLSTYPAAVSSSTAAGTRLPLPDPESFAQGDYLAPGEMGKPVVLKNLTSKLQDLVKVGWDNNAFDQYISDIISLNRSLPDVRDPSCRDLSYPSVEALPSTSVIICFHNEAWSVLLRTVHSIINRSPAKLVKEIILVDDYSNKDHLKGQLEDYIRQFNGKVKIVRASKREGLIRARLLGANAATAPVLTFLDSHCECAEGWLEPLLARIHEDPSAVVCPVIDVISDKTFEYHYKNDANAISVGGFDWNLQFNWHSVPEHEKKRRKHKYDPFRSPTMAGGLFSINKEFFERLGTYDSGFDIWGGENLEISFKTWMCGGTLEILPCSHVGHVFRSRSPYKWRTGVNVLKRNSVRLAEVWMDDYKKYYYDRIGHDLGDYGDISERLELRKRLHCKPFSYFVKEVYPELFVPGEAVAYGEVRNESPGRNKMCLDSTARKSDYQKPLGLYPCHGAGGNQYWLFSRDGEIRRDEACVDYSGHEVVLFPCHGSGGNQLWTYDRFTKLVKHTSGRCMELSRDRVRLRMSECDPTNEAQKWTFQHYNASMAASTSI